MVQKARGKRISRREVPTFVVEEGRVVNPTYVRSQFRESTVLSAEPKLVRLPVKEHRRQKEARGLMVQCLKARLV